MSAKRAEPASFSSISRETRRPDHEVWDDRRRHSRTWVRAEGSGSRPSSRLEQPARSHLRSRGRPWPLAIKSS
jgi:hypothetical protein